MLIFYAKHGMIKDKVHEITSFKQSKCLEKYIDFITQKRILTKSEVEKDFYKLFNNMQNVNCFYA